MKNSQLSASKKEDEMKQAKAGAFAACLCKELGQRTAIDGWTCKATKLLGASGRADVVLRRGRNNELRVLVEIELRRQNPVVNVVKTWLAYRRRPKRPAVLVHALSKVIYRRKTYKDQALFIGKEMQAQTGIKYIQIPFDFRPRKNTRSIGGAGKRKARLLAIDILKKLPRQVKRTLATSA
jgi:hypothetical protein